MDRKIQYLQFLPILSVNFITIPTKILARCFVDIEKLILKFIHRGKDLEEPPKHGRNGIKSES